MSLRVASFVLASLFAPALTAQAPLEPQWNPNIPPCLGWEPANSIGWPGGEFGDPAGFGRTLVAEFDQDFAPDAVVNCSGAVTVLWNVAMFDALQHVGFTEQPSLATVADIAVAPGEGPDGSAVIFASDDNGLRRITYSSGAFHGELVAGGSWIDAYPIRAEQLDAVSGLDLVGVATDHRTIVTRYCLLGGGNGQAGYEPGPTFTAPSNVRDVAAVDWDGDGVRELVALTLRGLVIYRLVAGSSIPPVLLLDSTGCITRFKAPGAPGGELLAWTRTGPNGPELKVLGSIGTGLATKTLTTIPTLCAGATTIVPVAIVAGDYDEHDGEELLLAHELNKTAIILGNLGASPWFATNSAMHYDIAALGTNTEFGCNVGIPAFADVDGQSTEDLVVPIDSSVEVLTELPMVRAIPQTTTVFFRSSDIVLEVTEYSPDTDVDTTASSRLRFAFYVPDVQAYANYTHLKMTVWHQTTSSEGQAQAASPNACYRRYHELVPSFVDNPTQYVELEFSFPDGFCWSPQEYFYTQFRFVRIHWDTGLQRYVEDAASPSFTGGLTIRKDCESNIPNFYDHLLDQGIPDKDFLLNRDNDLDGDPANENGATYVGAYVPMSSQPPFPANPVFTYPQPLTVGGHTIRVGQPQYP